GYKAIRAGISGLKIAFARRLNALLRRKGSVWDDRYHRHDLKTPLEVIRGIDYLATNFTHHGEWSFGDGVVDSFASTWLFEGWVGPRMIFHESERWRWPVCSAQTWLLREGWKKHERLQLKGSHPELPAYQLRIPA